MSSLGFVRNAALQPIDRRNWALMDRISAGWFRSDDTGLSLNAEEAVTVLVDPSGFIVISANGIALNGITTHAQGDLLYVSAANTLAVLAKDTTATTYLSNQGLSNNPEWNKINLVNGVQGVLSTLNGGTGLDRAMEFGDLDDIWSITGSGNTGVLSDGPTLNDLLITGLSRINGVMNVSAYLDLIGYGGQINVASGNLQIGDISEVRFLKFATNETFTTSDKTLTLTVNDADRTFALHGDLTVEAASTVNQDLTTDASVVFAGVSTSDLDIRDISDALRVRLYSTENLTADRQLGISVSDGNRIVTFGGNLNVTATTVLSGGTHSGTNTGDEDAASIRALGFFDASNDGAGSGLDADLLDGNHASAFQPIDATLTALAAYSTNGILTQTAADTFAGRTITGTTNQVSVSNGDGVSGNPTLSTPQDIHSGASPTFAGATLSGLTATAVLYAGTGGVVSGNDVNFAWDNTNKCLIVNDHTVAQSVKQTKSTLEVHRRVLSGGDPCTITLVNLRSGGWASGDAVHAIDFWSQDSSGAGAGVRARISSQVEGTSGAAQTLNFAIDPGSGLTEVFRFDTSGRFQVAPAGTTGQGKFNVFCDVAAQRILYGKLAASPTTYAVELEDSAGSDIFLVTVTGGCQLAEELTLSAMSSTPANPSASSEGRLYVKGGKLICQYNDAGTVRYKYLDLTGTGVTWVHTTTPP